ncbi:hypothetical protein [Brevundimonas sp. DS20]|uniref:hypothetical protein n=1 Tax=Brevundimonas sp. DS20 TaxID=1532555 RepID=UPI0006D02781|nr:hypothetical protein [Brevundimonas sp. DS20]ALJ08270.1 hypothetical protein JL11_07885 [Brevundimonas sp. DS20]
MEENKHTAADRVEAITSLIDNTGGAEREWITGDDLYEIMTTFDERADVSEIAAKINQRIALRTTPAPAVDLAELKRAIDRLLPITITETPDYAEVGFGECRAQAMTMEPDTWLALNQLPALIAQIERGEG